MMEPIHERMPVIISPEHWQHWLALPVERMEKLVTAFPEVKMSAWTVSMRANKRWTMMRV